MRAHTRITPALPGRAPRGRRPALARLLLAVAFVASLPGVFAFSASASAAAPSSTPVVDPSAAPFDLVPNGVIDYADVQEVVLAWTEQREITSPCANLMAPSRDVNHDGCITIADVQAVAARLGVATGTTPAGSAPAATSDALTAAAATTDAAQPQAQAFANLTFTVTTTSDADDATPGDGVCAIAAGGCSLRAAVTEANLAPGPNTIAFNIPGSGVQAIVINSELPAISEQAGPLTIDGYTQPGSAPNTDPVVSNAVIKIQITGPLSEPNINCTSSTCNLPNAFRVTSPNNVIRGLAFFKVRRSIWLSGSGAHGNVIAGNFIGTSASGQAWSTKSYNVAYGLALTTGAANNRFGGTAPADRNIISGNAQDGSNVNGEGSDGNQYIKNLIGLSPNGQTQLRNRNDGIDLNLGASSNVIDGNVIGGQLGDGIEISHGTDTSFNRVQNNFIGTNLTGKGGGSVYANAGFGITVEDGPTQNVITNNVIANDTKGGIQIQGPLNQTVTNAANQVTNNRLGVGVDGTPIPSGPYGVLIRDYTDHNVIGPGNIISNFGQGIYLSNNTVHFETFTQNSIFGNTGLGIDIYPAGVNLNDQYSHDGANNKLNFPIINSATPSVVSGTACAGCTVEVFKADNDPSGYGEGKTFVGSATANGSGAFTAAVSGLANADNVTATATDANGNTSEFSLNVAVNGVADTTAPAPPSGLTATGDLAGIHLDWADNTESDLAGYNVYRSASQNGTYTKLNSSLLSASRYDDSAAPEGATSYYQVTAVDQSGNESTPAATSAARPSSTQATQLPATLQAEDYRVGGEGVGYHDTTAGNSGGVYRTDDVDIQATTDAGGGYNVGWIAAGEWLAFDVNVPTAGNFTFTLRYASPSTANRKAHIEVDGVNVTGTILLPPTGGYQNWANASSGSVPLAAGNHVLKVVFDLTGWNLNYITVASDGASIDSTKPAAPTGLGATGDAAGIHLDWADNTEADLAGYNVYSSASQDGTYSKLNSALLTTSSYDDAAAIAGATTYYHVTAVDTSNNESDPASANAFRPAASSGNTQLPATLQAEDYRAGGEGVGYHDTTPGNSGGVYKTDDVDIQVTSDAGGGYNVGWIDVGEWLAFDVNVPTAGNFTFTLRYASPSSANRRAHVEVDGVNVTGSIVLPPTGGYQNWANATSGSVPLAAGDHVVKVVFDNNGWNLNYVVVASS